MFRTVLSLLIIVTVAAASAIAQPDSLWSNVYGARHRDSGNAIIRTADGGYAVAATIQVVNNQDHERDSGALLKIDSDGNQQFVQLFGGENNDNFWDLIQLGDGGYLLTGSTRSFGNGSLDGWIVRTDERGEEIWSQTYSGGARDAFTSVKSIVDDVFVLAGITTTEESGVDFWLISIDDNGELLWSETYGTEYEDYCGDVVLDDDGGFVMCGSTTPERQRPRNAYVIKVDAERNVVWTSAISTEREIELAEVFREIVKTADGFVMAGSTGLDVLLEPGVDDEFYLVKIDNNGEFIWGEEYGGHYDERAYSLVQTPDGGFLMGGFSETYGTGSSDMYLVRTNSDGDQLWHDTYGVGGREDCFDITNCSDGGYALTSTTSIRGDDLILDNIWVVKTGTDILRMLSLPDTTFEQNDTVKIATDWFMQFVIPDV